MNKQIMKIKEFEKAIAALQCDIKMVEVKTYRGKVRKFYGLKKDTSIMWDENGNSFTKRIDENENSIEESYKRNELYDLKF